MGAGALVLWHLRDRFPPGVLFGLYLILAGAERLLVEIVSRNDSVVAGLTQPQLISLALMALGAAVMVAAERAADGDRVASRNTTRRRRRNGG